MISRFMFFWGEKGVAKGHCYYDGERSEKRGGF